MSQPSAQQTSASGRGRGALYFGIMAVLFLLVGVFESWNLSLAIFNLCLISGIMALGVNIQWGYAGLFNAGIMGFTALGGVAAMLVSMPPVGEAWSAGGANVIAAGVVVAAFVMAIMVVRASLTGKYRQWVTAAFVLVGYVLARMFYDTGVDAIEAVDPASTGYLGGLGMPILFGWIVGGIFAAGAAWIVGKIALGLRADYLAIATLGISEIIIAMLKNEDWLTRGVKNVTGLPRPVPYEVDLIETPWFLDFAAWFGSDPGTAASIFVKLSYAVLFLIVLGILMWLSEKALNSPWGRMMRAIRDNRDAASAMGKNVTARHLQVFVLGCAVCGIAGAMLTTLDSQLAPTTYIPLRYTFLIWVMVILGGSGNNWGAVLGGFVIWFFWVQAEARAPQVMDWITIWLGEGNPIREHLLDAAPHMRLFLMGVILLVVMRFAPHGLMPEKTARR